MATTGYGQEKDRAAALAAGFDEHLAWPADAGLLQKLLARLPEATPRPAPAGPDPEK